MKTYIFLFLLIFTTSSYGCELVTVEELKQDIEQSFVSKSFTKFLKKYGDSQLIELKLEDEYNEKQSIEIHKFSNILAFNNSFWDMHEHTTAMLIPTPFKCKKHNCDYELPKYTLHHGVYLLGFQSSTIKKCTKLKSIYIYWA